MFARAVGTKANVLHWFGLERGNAALLILPKRRGFHFSFVCSFSVGRFVS